MFNNQMVIIFTYQIKRNKMTTSTFTMTKETQIAADFGLEFFANGYNKQIIYMVYVNGTFIKKLISTEYNKTMYAIILHMENKIDVKFSVNHKKKFSWAKSQTVVSAQ